MKGDPELEQGKPIKLCVVTTVPFTIRVFLLEQLVYLAQHGFSVVVVCDADDEFAEECPAQIQYHPLAMDRKVSVWSTLRSFWLLVRFLRKNKFDMLQYATPKAALLSSIAGWLVGVRVRLYCQWGIRYVGIKGWRRTLFGLLEKMACQFSTHVVPDSFENLAFAITEKLFPKEKGSVVHKGSANGVDLRRFDIEKRDGWRAEIYKELGIDSPLVVYGFLGRVTRDKGVNELVKAFLNIRQTSGRQHLIMVGPLEVNNGIRLEIMDAILSDANIHYVGHKNDVERYYAAMDVLVVPSYREGFGSVAIEAQAMGVPVISTDIPGPREAVVSGKTGILVPAKNVAELVVAMELLRDDIVMRQAMGKQGRDYVEEFYDQRIFWEKVLEHRLMLLKVAEEHDDTITKDHL